jgi:hypothetical protein
MSTAGRAGTSTTASSWLTVGAGCPLDFSAAAYAGWDSKTGIKKAVAIKHLMTFSNLGVGSARADLHLIFCARTCKPPYPTRLPDKQACRFDQNETTLL